jgi:hypothetical protein
MFEFLFHFDKSKSGGDFGMIALLISVTSFAALVA